MTLDQLEELFLHRQSCRAYDKDREVPEELLKRVCQAALLAPSACNTQPWKLYIVTAKDKVEAITNCVQLMGKNNFASSVPAYTIVTEGKGNFATTMGTKFDYLDFTHNDIGILTAHLILAADAAGLGTCVIGWRKEKSICKELGLPKGTRIPDVIAIGYPTEGYEIRNKIRKPDTETLDIIK